MRYKMKLQFQRNKKVKGKIYYRYVLILPKRVIELVGWKKGEQIKARVRKEEIVLTIK